MITPVKIIGQNHNGHNFPKTDRTQVELFARNFAARTMGNFVVFSPDADYYWTESGDWSGQTLRASIHPLQLVTIHPEMIVNLYSQTPADSGTLGFYDKSYVDFAGIEVSNGWLASCHKGSPEYGKPWTPYSAPRSACAAIDMPWFNPATGKYEPVSGAIPADRPCTFTRPSGWEDAVLLLIRPRIRRPLHRTE